MKKAIIIAVVSICCVFPSRSQQWVGITTQKIQPFAVSQWRDEWCWAASAQLVLNWYGIPISQDAIVQRSHGDTANRTGSDMDITFTLNGWAPTTGGVKIVHSTEFPGMLTPDLLYSNLKTGHPVLIAFQSGPFSGHVVVVTAAVFVPLPGGQWNVTTLVYRDPWPSPGNLASIGRVQLDGPQLKAFASTVRASWITWIT